ncbi:hypothetical protein OTU49_007164 [Cherax quadricarinatus]|uniref:Cuticle protein n=1 Tax=Cherax quadricarinatus TaxID=27406 RepID=A0AAW0WIX7_CHEQU|nr:uncharacterized protein LOC128698110 [Cherax quadricarinatus]
MKTALVVVAVLLCVMGSAQGYPQGGYKQPEGFFEYVNVPGHKEYEFGWNRGNPHHFISRFEQAKDHRFRTRVKWSDTYDGYGEHYWEYNHAPKYPEHDVYKSPEPAYGPIEPAYGPAEADYGPPKGYPSENIPVIITDPIEIQASEGYRGNNME